MIEIALNQINGNFKVLHGLSEEIQIQSSESLINQQQLLTIQQNISNLQYILLKAQQSVIDDIFLLKNKQEELNSITDQSLTTQNKVLDLQQKLYDEQERVRKSLIDIETKSSQVNNNLAILVVIFFLKNLLPKTVITRYK